MLTLTDDGLQLYHRSVQFRIDYLAGLFRDWPSDDRTTFARLFGRFADAVSE